MKISVLKRSITTRILIVIIAISVISSILATSIELYFEYKEDVATLKKSINQSVDVSKDNLVLSLWHLNERQLKLQLDNLYASPDITYVELIRDEDGILTFGEDRLKSSLEFIEPLIYLDNSGTKYNLGKLKIQSDLKLVQQRIFQRLYIIILTQSAKIFLVTLAIFYLINIMFTRHLSKIANFAQKSIDIDKNIDLKLLKDIRHDELDIVVESINSMRRSLNSKIETINSTKEKVEQLNKNLEERVFLRTEELNSQKKIYEQLFYETTDAITLLSNNKFIDCNDAAWKMFRYSNKKDLLGTHMAKLSPELQPDGENSYLKADKLIAKTMKEESSRFEWMHQKSDGENFWCEISLTRLNLNNDEIIHANIRDISEQKALQLSLEEKTFELEVRYEQLKQAQKKLIETEKMVSLGGLVAGVAHEINTPVGLSITGITHLKDISEKLKIQYSESDLTQNEFENYIDDLSNLSSSIYLNLKRAAELVTSFKKVAVSQSTEKIEKIQIKDILGDILLSMNSTLKQAKINISVICDDYVEMYTDAGAFTQIITNLIMNSLLHAFDEDDSGNIAIEISKVDNGIKLIFNDDGKGISPEIIGKIFDPFFTTNRSKGGTGLGLNIIYNIVTSQMNGTINVESTENVGTSFTIDIPFKSDKNRASEA